LYQLNLSVHNRNIFLFKKLWRRRRGPHFAIA
jgi:hypothetical protein